MDAGFATKVADSMFFSIIDFPDFTSREMLGFSGDFKFDQVIRGKREVVAMRSQHRVSAISMWVDVGAWLQTRKNNPDEISISANPVF